MKKTLLSKTKKMTQLTIDTTIYNNYGNQSSKNEAANGQIK